MKQELGTISCHARSVRTLTSLYKFSSTGITRSLGYNLLPVRVLFSAYICLLKPTVITVLAVRQNQGAPTFALTALLALGLPLLLTLVKFVTPFDDAHQTLLRDAHIQIATCIYSPILALDLLLFVMSLLLRFHALSKSHSVSISVKAFDNLLASIVGISTNIIRINWNRF